MESETMKKQSAELEDIRFACDGKCRICPFPGANCAKEIIKSEGEEHA